MKTSFDIYVRYKGRIWLVHETLYDRSRGPRWRIGPQGGRVWADIAAYSVPSFTGSGGLATAQSLLGSSS